MSAQFEPDPRNADKSAAAALTAARSPRDRWSSPPTLPAGGLPSPRRPSGGSFDISRCRVGVPGGGRRKIIPDGGAAGPGSLAGPSDKQIHGCRISRGYRRPVLAPRAGGL